MPSMVHTVTSFSSPAAWGGGGGCRASLGPVPDRARPKQSSATDRTNSWRDQPCVVLHASRMWLHAKRSAGYAAKWNLWLCQWSHSI